MKVYDKRRTKNLGKLAAAAAAVMLVLAGCREGSPENSVMPQNVPSDIRAVQDSDTQSGTAAETAEAAGTEGETGADQKGTAADGVSDVSRASSAAEAETQAGQSSAEELLDALYTAKAEMEALDVDEDILEAEVRTGKITREEFESREKDRNAQEEQMEQEEERLERELKNMGFRDRDLLPEEFVSPLASMELQELLTLLNENETEKDLLEAEEERLERQYLNNEITRDEFVLRQAEHERNAELYDAREDMVEYYLELLGWDD